MQNLQTKKAVTPFKEGASTDEPNRLFKRSLTRTLGIRSNGLGSPFRRYGYRIEGVFETRSKEGVEVFT
jgi:hypothetical protein